VWDVTDLTAPFQTDFVDYGNLPSPGTLVQYQNTFFVAGTSITYFTLNTTGQVQTLGSFFVNNTYVIMGLFVFNNKLVASLELGGEASFNIGPNNVYTLDGQFTTLAAPLQAAADNYAYGALYTCRWLSGPVGNYAYYLNIVPTAGLTDIAQGELRTAVLDNTVTTTTASVTTASTATVGATTAGVSSTTRSTVATVVGTTGGATTSALATSGATASSATVSTSATTGTSVQLHQTITLTYPVDTVVSDQDVRDLITRAGGNPSDWSIAISSSAGKKTVVEIQADASVVSSSDAVALQQAISTDATFVAAGGTSSVKVNQKSASSTLSVLAVILILLVVPFVWY
jgi:hypothetical protein